MLFIGVVGMDFFQFALTCVNLGSGESPSPIGRERVAGRSGEGQPSHNIQHVQRPAALGDGNIFQRFDALEFFADFGGRNDDRPKNISLAPPKRGEGQGAGI